MATSAAGVGAGGAGGGRALPGGLSGEEKVHNRLNNSCVSVRVLNRYNSANFVLLEKSVYLFSSKMAEVFRLRVFCDSTINKCNQCSNKSRYFGTCL